MFYGSLRSVDPERSMKVQSQFFSQFTSLPFDDKSALMAGEIRAKLASTGKIIGAYDIQIAAIALANELTLVTHNTREFSRIRDLRLADWESE